jgi:acetolactate synthase-1/2/3 large subunit
MSGTTGGKILVAELLARSVDTVFCVPGESYLAALDAFHDVADRIRLIVCRHEAGAANMAEAWGKLTGAPGICFVTRGPGACHASIGVHTAKQDSTPLILFVGQVPRDQREREAFQEVDYRATFADLAKWSTEIDDPERIPEIVNRAFMVATTGRPGPVVVALPEDVLQAATTAAITARVPLHAPAPGGGAVEDTLALLATARRPMLLLGGSGWTDPGVEAVAEFARTSSIPVVCGWRRQHLFDNRLPQYVGDAGIGVNPALKARIAESDVVLALGTRLGDIVTDGYTTLRAPTPAQAIVHVHQEPGELGRVYVPRLAIQSDPNAFAIALARRCSLDGTRWRNWCEEARADYERWQLPVPFVGPVDMASIVRWLSEHLPDDAIVANGAGNFAAWLHRFFRYKRRATQLAPTSGAMGYGLPAAIAAKLRSPRSTVVAWTGDGCFMMAVQELATVVRHEVPVIVVIVNNSSYGTIRMHQERHYPGRVVATDLVNADFVSLAGAFGLRGYRVTRTDEFAPAFIDAEASGKAALIEIVLPTAELSPTMKLARTAHHSSSKRTP